MKEVKWKECLGHGVIGTHPPVDGKMHNPLDPVQTGMHVVAKYSGVDVHLRIQDAEDQEGLTAEVLFFAPVLAEKPEDLSEGDIVLIDRAHVCWTYND